MVPKMGPMGLDDVCYYIVFCLLLLYTYYTITIIYIYIVWLNHINTYIHVFISSLYVTIDLIYNIIFHWG